MMATQPTEDRPEEIGGVNLEEAFIFLDILRESGVTNMYGAGRDLREEYSCSKQESHKILAAWMQDFGK